MARSVLLAGATGYIGSRLAQELRASGYTLYCPVRDVEAPAARALSQPVATGAEESAPEAPVCVVATDLSDPKALVRDLAAAGADGTDAVISCLASRSGGIRDSEAVEYAANHHLLEWALATGVGQFTLLSAICVQKPRLAFQHAKLRFERELAASGIAHSIVRPTAFFKSLSGQLERVRAGKPFLLFGNGELTRCKPIAEADLARYLRLTLEDPRLRGVLPIGGPGPALTPLDQARIMARLTGQPLRTRSVPPALLRGAARVLDMAARLRPSLADKAEFARIGHYYATESMLVWDDAGQCYDDVATPEFGTVTLEASYRAQLDGRETQALGEHAVFQ